MDKCSVAVAHCILALDETIHLLVPELVPSWLEQIPLTTADNEPEDFVNEVKSDNEDIIAALLVLFNKCDNSLWPFKAALIEVSKRMGDEAVTAAMKKQFE